MSDYTIKTEKINPTIILIFTNIIFYIYTQGLSGNFIRIDTKVLREFNNNFFTLILHRDISHLVINMITLYIFGTWAYKYYNFIQHILIYSIASIIGIIASSSSNYVSPASSPAILAFGTAIIIHILLFRRNMEKLEKGEFVGVYSVLTMIVWLINRHDIEVIAGSIIFGLLAGIITPLLILLLRYLDIKKILENIFEILKIVAILGTVWFIVSTGSIRGAFYEVVYTIGESLENEDKTFKDFQITTSNGLSNEFRFGNYSENSIELLLKDNKLRINNIPNESDFKYVWVQFQNKDTGEVIEGDIEKIKKDSYIQINLPKLSSGEYYIDLFSNNIATSTFNSFIYKKIVLLKNGGELGIKMSPVYEHNKRVFEKKRVANEDLNVSRYYSANSIEIVHLAQSITAGIERDYEKVLAIHDWVSENIYYDKDALKSGYYGRQGIAATLQSKKGVCQEYVELTTTLIRAMGIPCKLILGYALGIDSEGEWTSDNVNSFISNHAWNEVFVDNRWIILDTTWDSTNIYENGEYKKCKGIRRVYFDPTIEMFSMSHKIIDN
ncbi:rhomboid family intramembrane serine protease [Clostridium sp. ZS2-4]|uniref:rhomboid family intramembrane serine protease n=1 Tax=Clostridium sp. ZS2-4 TaxID=2987703 RepID=UPI00227AA8DE|nr:rhomboid family intramembrane serine protease [Clostridium sp. ZS2-4]MCY6354372.1 rhomboid family intramembrane serine protease [Clostridium sp. ZS2-4]